MNIEFHNNLLTSFDSFVLFMSKMIRYIQGFLGHKSSKTIKYTTLDNEHPTGYTLM